MPIYEYRCNSCGAQDDVMQKMSDAALTTCPVCGKDAYAKQISAAGFQLKGDGYYVTDFKNSASKSGSADKTSSANKPGSAGKAGAASSE